MISYEKFAPFYDAVMGDRESAIAEVLLLLKKHHPACESVLELACGTGAILEGLKSNYQVEGLDLSPDMLRVARKKLKGVKFHKASMTSFNLKERFDAIICVFDSINHLTSFTDWKRVFSCSHQHLNEGGVLLFDVNTPAKLESFGRSPVWVHHFDGHYLLMDVTCDKKFLSQWDIKVFERRSNGDYRLHQEVIQEKAFPHSKIKDALSVKFSKVKVVDLKARRVSSKSEKLHFIATK